MIFYGIIILWIDIDEINADTNKEIYLFISCHFMLIFLLSKPTSYIRYVQILNRYTMTMFEKNVSNLWKI